MRLRAREIATVWACVVLAVLIVSTAPAAAAPGQHAHCVFAYGGTPEDEAAARALFAAVQDLWTTARNREYACEERGDAGGGMTLCPTVGDIPPSAVAFHVHRMDDPAVPWGDYGFDDMSEIARAREEARFAGAGLVIYTAFVTPPEGYLQCILPPGYRNFVETDALVWPVGSGADVDAEATTSKYTPRYAASWVAQRAHVEIDEDYLAWHDALVAGLYRPGASPEGAPPHACEEVDVSDLTPSRFRESYLRRSRPVVIKNGAAAVGNALWTAQYIRERVGGREVSVKVAPGGVFEGPEPLADWVGARGFNHGGGGLTHGLPPHVHARLVVDDRVIVRPAVAQITVDSLLQGVDGEHRRPDPSASSTEPASRTTRAHVDDGEADAGAGADGAEGVCVPLSTADPRGADATGTTQATNKSSVAGDGRSSGGEGAPQDPASFYLEYSSVAALKELAADVRVPWFAEGLQVSSKNVWFGGRTLGKLHFDPFDNIMSVAVGEKVFTVFHPHRNERAYEGHIREGFLEYDAHTGAFTRGDLPDTTALVMSPVRIDDARDRAVYPTFDALNRTRLTCRVAAGDALYLPAFWWHEVASPAPHTLAANLWFKPYFDKAFPCASCRVRYNKKVYGDPGV